MIVPTENRCGDCTVCCEIMGFTGEWALADRYNEADKLGVVYDEWSNCNKLCSTGCSIQNKKPQICDEFFCSYVEHDLDIEYRPNGWGFVGHIQPSNGALGILSMDKTLPPDIQYNNNRQMLDQFIEEVMVSEGKRLVVYLHTKQGAIRIR
jgi:hypothetical protein